MDEYFDTHTNYNIKERDRVQNLYLFLFINLVNEKVTNIVETSSGMISKSLLCIFDVDYVISRSRMHDLRMTSRIFE